MRGPAYRWALPAGCWAKSVVKGVDGLLRCMVWSLGQGLNEDAALYLPLMALRTISYGDTSSVRCMPPFRSGQAQLKLALPLISKGPDGLRARHQIEAVRLDQLATAQRTAPRPATAEMRVRERK
jgi:hypothetical protein